MTEVGYVTHRGRASPLASRVWSTSLQKMAWHPVGANPSSEPMVTTCRLEHGEQSSVKYLSKFELFHRRNCVLYCRLRFRAKNMSTPMSLKTRMCFPAKNVSIQMLASGELKYDLMLHAQLRMRHECNFIFGKC